ncbi:hypothetical protein GCM10027299_03300 [Larkinella ripae]
MRHYKVKVYLGETREIRQKGSRRYVASLTHWTFVTAATREVIRHKTYEDDIAGFFYRDCAGVDGSDWKLEEIDSLVGKNELTLPKDYQVFSREYDGH